MKFEVASESLEGNNNFYNLNCKCSYYISLVESILLNMLGGIFSLE